MRTPKPKPKKRRRLVQGKPRVRSSSGPPAFQALREIGADFLAELDTRLLDGETSGSIAKWIQEDLKKLVEMQVPSLRKVIERYRSKELRAKTFKRIADTQRNVPFGTVAVRVHALNQMDELVVVQRARLQKMLNLEEGKPMLLNATTEEVRLMQQMLVDLAKLQVETGVLPRAGKVVSGLFTDSKGDAQKVEWTEEFEKVFKELTGAEGEEEEAA